MIYIIKNDLSSLFSAIFTYYVDKDKFVKVYTEYNQISYLEEIKYIENNQEGISRVERALRNILKGKFYDIKWVFKSGLEDKNTIKFDYLRKVLYCKIDISENFNDPIVYRYNEIFEKVKKEVHHLKGFIRFSKTPEGIYYAPFTPDNDVCDLIFPHFKNRFKSMPFILHDLRFDVIIAYNGKESKTIKQKIPPLTIKDEYNNLFKTYYNSVNIVERRNVKTMRNFLPKRYQTFMPEKNELL